MSEYLATAEEGLNPRRRYLVAAGHLLLPDEPEAVHLALYTWHERAGAWLVGQSLCGRSVEGTPLFDGTGPSCAACEVYRATYEAALAREAARLHSPVGRSGARHPEDTPENGAWCTVWLEGNWRWVTSRMTTEQREYAADRVAAYGRVLAAADGEDRPEPEGLRWWRTEG
ncbi:hypothetical protein ACH4TP_38050 [Streptomyces sp. NPDC021012]|uniref:hypothetical protein n=1 Tax=Streptomyces sp. NPDC021012 TaxID=3365107 RepID=UPI003791E131